MHVKVEIISDFSCPWCYVGVKRLESALDQLKEDGEVEAHVEFFPFRIDPATADGGEDYMAYNERRWGSDGWTQSLRRQGAPDGCSFANWKWWPNSLQAHAAVCAASSAVDAFVELSKKQREKDQKEKKEGGEDKDKGEMPLEREGSEVKAIERTRLITALQLNLVLALLRRVYEEGGNVSSAKDVEEVVARSGWEGEGKGEIRDLSMQLLQEPSTKSALIDKVITLERSAKRDLKVTGVPMFLIGPADARGRRKSAPTGHSGAQPTSVLLAAIKQAAQGSL
uniref:DSBA-like thioredoxin domain-containing protein n=1 Tax=Chromera velia CCMP2878 TaxID=1169474 RepID=A0A0G4IA48_9ALVE|mmetsp:Transcript_31661/g.62661  ORF Transcript_31661/g.62661 Transcript_31661/m.62661 type:complete len:282 (-) Transcript_31661:136-981(-)|eukprot:Cvel_12459.t1-p1 / transcript=Cvel_12459.t1 / gene=Cvel_12459 / organism=Chromera_velia_CCMP2878 / gene_product=hypothetical protein / transcript_product=hypothetical protein / location=Cvel_scaffold816:29542-38371(+) / protein_length=281 / sequence_SO=supercontig / SO=protein_coding / is_pseudo=false